MGGLDAERVEYLLAHHSDKHRLGADGTPPDLTVLMEADELDETGAVSVIWDAMLEGGESDRSLVQTYRHIVSFTGPDARGQPLRHAARAPVLGG